MTDHHACYPSTAELIQIEATWYRMGRHAMVREMQQRELGTQVTAVVRRWKRLHRQEDQP